MTCMYFTNLLTLKIRRWETRTIKLGDSDGYRLGGTSWERKWQYGNIKPILNRTEQNGSGKSWSSSPRGEVAYRNCVTTEEKAKIKAIRWIITKGEYKGVLSREQLVSDVIIRKGWMFPRNRVLTRATELSNTLISWNKCFRTIFPKK